MLNEWKEFQDYTGAVNYTARNKQDTTYLGRFTFDTILDFEGLNRVLTILARGFAFHNEDGSPAEAPRERIDYAKRGLCAWCSVPSSKKATPREAWQFGSEALAAPQATLMKMITEGVMEGNLPWTLIFIGVFIGVAVEIMGVPVLPVAIGLYLPFELSASILVGGILRYVSSRKKKDAEGGILFCSGLIAGEGLMGIVLALLAVFGKSDKIDLSHWMDTGIFGAAALVFVIAACILISAREKKKPAD